MLKVSASIGVAFLFLLALAASQATAHRSAIVLEGLGTATVDGVMAPGEWTKAASYDFRVKEVVGSSTEATLLVMNDKTNLYLAFRIARAPLGKSHVGIWFDDDHDGRSTPGQEDGVSFWTGDARGFVDEFRCATGFCRDTDAGGQNDGSAAAKDTGGTSFYELSHPLASADSGHDFALSPGKRVGFDAVVEIYDGADHQSSCVPVCDILDTSSFGDLVIATPPAPPPPPPPTTTTTTKPPPPPPVKPRPSRPTHPSAPARLEVAASFRPSSGSRLWRESTLHGSLDVHGRAPRSSTLTFALHRGRAVPVTGKLNVHTGPFRTRLVVPDHLLVPGTYVLVVRSNGGVRGRQLTVALPKPPEGVVTEAFASQRPLRHQARIPKSATIVFVNFRFAASPTGGLPVVVHWRLPTGDAGTKPVTRAGPYAFSYVANGLPVGRYSCVLTAGGIVVKRLQFRLG